MLQTNSYSLTHCGNVREHNEDALYSNNDTGIWLLADGMGGHASGEVASHLAVTLVSEALHNKTNIKQAINTAHLHIINEGENNPSQHGMGTTLVAVQRKKGVFNVSWVGDSRVYHFDNKLRQLTTDHTFVQDMVYRDVLSSEEAENHPQRNLLVQSLGMLKGHFNVDSLTFRPKASSGVLLLCSDGVSDYLSKTDIELLISTNQKPELLSEAIKEAVLVTEAGDNLSVVVVAYKLSIWQLMKNWFIGLLSND